MEIKLSTLVQSANYICVRIKNLDSVEYNRITSIRPFYTKTRMMIENQFGFDFQEYLNFVLDNFDEISFLFDYEQRIIDSIKLGLSVNRQVIFNTLYSKNLSDEIAPMKYVFSKEETMSRGIRPAPNGYKFMINGIVCCTVRTYTEAFCSKNSMVRDVTKKAKETIWDWQGIKKATGLNVDRNAFRNSYPDTTHGWQGSVISYKEFKETIIAYINSFNK